MTISNSASQQLLAGDGNTTVFTYNIIPNQASDISVSYTSAPSVISVLDPSQYTLTINPPSSNQLWGVGGTLAYPSSGSPIAPGTYLTIQRTVPLTQLVTIQNQGNVYPRVTEQALDILEMQIQQIQQQLNNIAQGNNSPIFSGTISAAAFVPTGNIAPAGLGIYTPSANAMDFVANGASQFEVFNGSAGAVNKIQAVGANAGFGVTFNAVGSDTNISLSIYSKGTNPVNLGTRNGTTQVKVTDTSGATNLLQLTGGNGTAANVSTSNGDLGLNSQTGFIEFLNANSFSATGAISTALTALGPTGSHTTVQTWLVIKDNGGVKRYVPCF